MDSVSADSRVGSGLDRGFRGGVSGCDRMSLGGL